MSSGEKQLAAMANAIRFLSADAIENPSPATPVCRSAWQTLPRFCFQIHQTQS